jgi:hypothetical protein
MEEQHWIMERNAIKARQFVNSSLDNDDFKFTRFGPPQCRVCFMKPDNLLGHFLDYGISLIGVAITILQLRQPWERAARLNTNEMIRSSCSRNSFGTAEDEFQ